VDLLEIDLERGTTKQGASRNRLLQELLHAKEPMAVDPLARALEISRNATYLHITALERDGLIEKAELSQTKGRPGQTYQLSRSGRETFTRHYALFADLLIGLVKSRLGPDELRSCLEALGQEIAQEYTDRVAGLDRNEQLVEVAKIMRELGYESRATESKGKLASEIVAHNCVFHDLAEQHSEVCSLDIALIEALTGSKIEHAECMLRGGSCCRFKRKT